MKSIASIVIILTFFNTVSAQKIITSDIDNFWLAYDSLRKAENGKSEILEALFLNKKTDGLSAFMKIKNFDETDYLEVMDRYPLFWNSIRSNTLIDKRKIKSINKALNKLKQLYPINSNGNIYYIIGTLKSGGTINNKDLLLGIEKIVGDKNTIVSEFENQNLQEMFQFTNASKLEQITIHEFVHTFQKEGEINLLSKAIKEGSCDFVAELALNRKFISNYIDYGFKNYESVKSEFKKEMFSQNFQNWFYNGDRNKNPDLGYFVGYVISKKYYEKSTDKQQAIKDLIEVNFNDESEVLQILEKSKYFDEEINVAEIKAEYKKNQPKVVRIIEFDNGSTTVNTDLKQIQVVFSKPMDEKISINFSKNGKEHFPLKSVIGLDESQTILSLETTDLSPDTDYDFYITDRGTQSIDGYPFIEKEYVISFKTKQR
ncbi:Ig-like domain-containing protein [Flavobacterium rhizosphaerae]|uniref:Ig-like domain-containing protein n=1 Tax=Flavobacterium rhizosphaerae TaxID=3163298 RepID=A0ABW8YTT8_9FLAO